MADIIVRPYRKEDRPAVREIAFDTALIGEPATPFIDDKELMADILTAYFTDHEPASCFVAESAGKVAGYIIGAKDAKAMHAAFAIHVLPRILLKIFTSPLLLKNPARTSIYNFVKSIFKGEFNAPPVYKDYPAMLHINVAKEFRHLGAGARLMVSYLEYLKLAGVRGVHLVTMSEAGASFFVKEGFSLLYQAKRSCFNHILHKDTPVLIYGKKITLTAQDQD
jgi:hypothetical protein